MGVVKHIAIILFPMMLLGCEEPFVNATTESQAESKQSPNQNQGLVLAPTKNEVSTAVLIAVPKDQAKVISKDDAESIFDKYRKKQERKRKPSREASYQVQELTPAEWKALPGFAREYVRDHLPGLKFFAGELDEWGQAFLRFNDNPRWQSETPWWVTIDFNGDLETDWIGFLVRRDDSYYRDQVEYQMDLVCICSSSNGYRHTEIMKGAGSARPGHTHHGVYLAGKSELTSQVDGEGEVLRPFESVEYMNHEKSSRVFYWNGQSVQEIWTSD